MFARNFIRFSQVATGAVVGGSATSVVIPSHESNNAVDPTLQQSTNVFEAYREGDLSFYSAENITENSSTNLINDKTMLTFGVTGSEFNTAISSLQENPDIIFDILPSMNLKHKNQLFNALNDILNNPQIISTVKSKVNCSNNIKNINQEFQFTTNSNDNIMFNENETNTLSQWEKLKNEHPCVICQDLLAKPTILQCSHSFCGSCLDELFTSSYTTKHRSSNDSIDDIDDLFDNNHIIHQCPTCKHDIFQYGIYERTLDEVICSKADLIYDCPEKMNWQERRNAHIISKQQHLSSRNKELRDNNNEDEDDSWESIQNWAIPAIAFVIITLIAICRYK